MKSLNNSLKEYINSLTFSKKSKLVWTGAHYTVSYYYSDKTLAKLDWQIIL